jgi:ubiquinone/menaquinone biosynthesis C-methylase UbiE
MERCGSVSARIDCSPRDVFARAGFDCRRMSGRSSRARRERPEIRQRATPSLTLCVGWLLEGSRMSSVLSHREARSAYDRIGSLQDTQAFYEDRATDVLLRHADFGSAKSVFEFGCGTGRFAERLLRDFLPPDARYRGVDVSPKMISFARARLESHPQRAQVSLTEGDPPVAEPSQSCDRFLSNYVFDLLSEEDIRDVLREAHRMLRPGGLLCLSGLSTGVGPVSRSVARAWNWIQVHRPSLVGGCRPIDLLPFLPESAWHLRHHEKRVAFGITSEALVAERRGGNQHVSG